MVITILAWFTVQPGSVGAPATPAIIVFRC
jgi:hypothetical protein